MTSSPAHSYASEYPAGVDFDPEYKKFFEDFYKTSDTPDVHDDYVQNFTKTATLIRASHPAKGHDGASPCPPAVSSQTCSPHLS